jgi:hypothetical protein
MTNSTPPPFPPPPPQTPVYAAPSRGMFGTGIPGTIAFAVGVILFFMPFIDIKCNSMSLQTVSGFQLATGFKMKNNSSGNSLLNDLKTDDVDKTITKTTTNSDKKDPNLFAMVAMGLGILGLLLSFAKAKAALGGAMVTGVASAAALIGMMLDIKKKIKLDMPKSTGKTGDNDLTKGLENIHLTVDFTIWFYVAVIAFLAAAFFCFKRMQSSNKL